MEEKQTTETKPKKFYKQWWFWVIVILVLLLLASASSEKTTPSETSTPSGTPETASEAPEEAYIDAYDIIKDYVDNTVVADSKYRDKTLEIQGTVADIGKDLIDTPFLTIKGSKFTFEAIRCNFDKADETLLASVEKNQHIVVEGLIIGEKLGTVIMQNCEIIK